MVRSEKISNASKQRSSLDQSGPDLTRFSNKGLHPILQLQRTIGNGQVANLIRTKRLTHDGRVLPVQPKLTVGASDDQFEKQANDVAKQVVSTPDSVLRSPTPAEQNDEHELQTKPLAAAIAPVAQQHDAANEPQERESDGYNQDGFDAGAAFEAQINASKGSGRPLPDGMRAYLEPRFGADFSEVRVHTGNNAIQMNRAIGARAFTHGSDIYFGDAQGAADAELTAHELTHVVQQNANLSSATGTLSTKLIQRYVPKWTFEHGAEKSGSPPPGPSDMVEVNWDAISPPTQGPKQPTPFTLKLGPIPKAPGSNQQRQGPASQGQPATWDDGSARASDIRADRQASWSALELDVSKALGSYNMTAPLIDKFNAASNDPVLADLYGVPAKGPGDLGSKVESKVVGGRNDRSGTTVGGLFGTGTAIDTKSVAGNIDKAAHGDVNSQLVVAMAAFKAADHDFKAESAGVQASIEQAHSAGHELEAANFLKEELKAGQEKQRAEAELAELKEKSEKVKKYLGWAIKGVTFVVGLALAPEVAIPAAVAEAAGGDSKADTKPAAPAAPEAKTEEKKGGLPEGAGEKATWAAEKAVDFWYAGGMSKISAKIREATAEMAAAHAGYIDQNQLAKADDLASSLDKVTEAMERLKAKVIVRRNTFRAIAQGAAAEGGGTQQQKQTLQGIIMAVPACETVVTATSNILDSIQDVPYTPQSGVGAGMAYNSGQTATVAAMESFSDVVSFLKGYKTEFQAKNKLWTDRLMSAKELLTALGKDSA